MESHRQSNHPAAPAAVAVAHQEEHEGAVPDNPTMLQGFEWYCPADHKHWHRLEKALPAYAALGVSSMWIPPACKASWYTGNGYDIYDLYDLGEFDQKGSRHTKWGTKQGLAAFAHSAERLGIRVLFDAILNHKAAADRSEKVMATRIDPENRLVAIEEPTVIEAWSAYEFPGRGSTYSPLRWNKEHFNGIDYCHKLRQKGVWKFEGKEWADDVDEELANYDYLMFANIDHTHPEVRRDLFYWIQWLASQIPLGGLRLDAIKHYSARFLKDFIDHIDRTVGRDWFIVGEYWREDVDVLAKYVEFMNHRISLFDVRLVMNFSRLSHHPNTDLRTIFDGSLVSAKPNNAVTFVTNHDTMEGQSLEAPVAEFFIPHSHAMILLRADSGLPCVFYGDLYGYHKPGSNHFVEPPFGGQLIPKLMLARKLYAYGPQVDYFDHPHGIGFTRLGHPALNGLPHATKAAGLAVVMTNGWSYATKTMFLGKQHAGERWTDLLASCWGEVVIDEEGWGVFAAAPRSVAVWVNRDAPGRREVDNYKFDHDIYQRRVREEPLTANALYTPLLPTQPAWLGAPATSAGSERL